MDIPKIKEFSNYNKYPGETRPTTDAEMQTYMDNQNKVLKASAMRLWQPSTSYDKNDVVFHPHQTEMLLMCAVPGTTSDSVIPITEAVVDDVIEDGTVVWVVKKFVTEVEFQTATHEQITEIANS